MVRINDSTERLNAFKNLLSRNLITSLKNYVCKKCLYWYGEQSQPELDITQNNTISSETNQEQLIIESIHGTINHIKTMNWKSLSDKMKESLTQLASELGKVISNDIFDDGKLNVASQHKNIDIVNEVEPLSWIKELNPLLQGFLQKCAAIDINRENNDKKINVLAHSIEQVLYRRNVNFVTPFAFKRNLVLYSVTNSKELANMNRKWEGCGSSTTLSNVICEPVPPLDCPEEDQFSTIDNNQKVGVHSGRIKEGSKVPLSICTSMCHIVRQPKTFLQYDSSLSPAKWWGKSSVQQLLEKVHILEKDYITEFQRYRGQFIEEMIECVIRENSNFVNFDYVDVAIANQGKVHTCSQCSNTYNRQVSICPTCQLDANYFPRDFDPYYRTESRHPTEKPLVNIGEPFMVNPNSLDNVKTVLDHVSVRNKISDNEDNKRKWTFMISDGVPYIYASILQDTYVPCSICNEEVSSHQLPKDEFEILKKEHSASHENEKCFFNGLFANIVLLPGPGHVELNMRRLLLKLCTDVRFPHRKGTNGC